MHGARVAAQTTRVEDQWRASVFCNPPAQFACGVRDAQLIAANGIGRHKKVHCGPARPVFRLECIGQIFRAKRASRIKDRQAARLGAPRRLT